MQAQYISNEPSYGSISPVHGDRLSLPHDPYSRASPPKTAHANYIPYWPEGPSRLQISIWNKLIKVFSDILLLGLSSLFAVLGVFVGLLRNQPQSNWGSMVLQATKIAPTVWPLVFAAVIGNLLKARASRKLQNGASLGVIEQLVGSQTVFGTIKSAVTIRRFGFLTFALLGLWSLNPIGGQASLRALSSDTPTETLQGLLNYMSLDPLIALRYDVLQGASSIAYYRPLLASLFGSALYSPEAALQYLTGSNQEVNLTACINRLGGPRMAIQRAQQDSWANVRIPALHLLPGYGSNDASAWVQVPDDQIPPLSSIIGIPLRNAIPVETAMNSGNLQKVVPDSVSANITLTIETNYYRFECSDWDVLDSDQLDEWLVAHNYNVSQHPFSVHHGTGFVLGMEDFDSAIQRSRSDLWANNDTTTQIPARTIWFASKGYASTRSTEPVTSITYCALSTEYVEAQLQCAYAGADSTTRCFATHLRPSQTAHLSPNFTELDFGSLSNHFLVFAGILPEPHPATSSPQEFFLYDPPGAFTNSSYSATTIQMSNVPIEVFQARLALLYNTFSIAAKAPNLILGGEFSDPFGTGTILQDTAAQWTYLVDPVYRIHTAWLVVYLLSVAVLCISALATIVVRWHLSVPDILGYVASLTRDSPFVHVPSAASTLNGDERARLLRDVLVRLQDVQPGEQVGRIALSSDRALGSVPLQQRRLYE